MPKPLRQTRYPFSTAENAYAAFQNVGAELDRFLTQIAPDLTSIGGDDGEAAYLREIITEHLKAQFPEAFEAVSEFYEGAPL